MQDESPNSRVFQEKEIAAILKRAAEIQSDNRDEHAVGLTKEELARVAKDAGIDPRSVAAAIREMDLDVANESFEIQEDNTSVTIDRVTRGVVDDDTWESLIAELRRTFRVSGKSFQRGATREWVLSDGAAGVRNVCVSITPQGEQSQLQLMWSDPTRPIPGYIIAMVLSIILIPVIFESLGMVSIAGGIMWLTLALALFSLARFIASRSANASKLKMEKLVARLEKVIAIGNAEKPVRTAATGDIAAVSDSDTREDSVQVRLDDLEEGFDRDRDGSTGSGRRVR